MKGECVDGNRILAWVNVQCVDDVARKNIDIVARTSRNRSRRVARGSIIFAICASAATSYFWLKRERILRKRVDILEKRLANKEHEETGE